MHTGNAAVRSLEVWSEVFRTRLSAYERRIGHTEVAGRTPGADDIQLIDDVRGAADVSKVARDAASELHATELGVLH